jgi:RES domain-containing protein
MPEQARSFKRIVLGLQPSAADHTLQLAVELADLLHLDLLGLLLEDTSLRDFARIPFARELRPLGGGWHAIDLDQLSHDFDVAARSIERMFTETAKRLATNYQFEVAHGPLAKIFASVPQSGDIVMIVEPLNPAERASQQFAWLLDAAFRSTAAVMLVPPRIARTKGPVVAIAASPDDPSMHTAATIAAALKEELVIIEADGRQADETRLPAPPTGLTVRRVAAAKAALPDPATCAQAFRQTEERLVVMSRGAFEDTVASTIASARRVPVLVVEPPEALADETRTPMAAVQNGR